MTVLLYLLYCDDVYTVCRITKIMDVGVNVNENFAK